MTKDNLKHRLAQMMWSAIELESYKDLVESMDGAFNKPNMLSKAKSRNLYSVMPEMNMDVDYVDYDGKCFLYKDGVVELASQSVCEFLTKFCKDILTHAGKTKDQKGVEICRAARSRLLCNLQHGGLIFDCWKTQGEANDMVAVTANLEIPEIPNVLHPETASETHMCIVKLFQGLSNNKNTLIVCPPTFPAADVIGFGRQIFQVVFTENQSLDYKGMKKVLVSAGILAASGQEINEGAQPIILYWVVPPGSAFLWKNLVQHKFQNDQAILQEAMQDYVEEFILELPFEENILDEESNDY